MGESSSRADVERLLAEASWVRGLAVRLLGEEAEAEDLVQDVWIAALESGGTVHARRGPVGLRAWVARVLWNLALRRRHQRGLRERHEALAAGERRSETGGDEVERMETQRLLAEEILALEEPYRGAVILRHLDGLRPEAIAERQGITEAAARQRVSRGLARLRARLERRLEGERGVVRALALVAGPAAGGKSGPLWIGGGLVGAKGIAAGVVVVGVLGLVVARMGEERPSFLAVGPAGSTPAGKDAPAAAGAALDRDAAPEGSRVSLESPRPPGDPRLVTGEAGGRSPGLTEVPGNGRATDSHSTPTEASDADPALPRIRGQLLEPEGQPVTSRGRLELGLLAEETGEEVRLSADVDEEGSFLFAGVPAGRLRWMSGMAEGFVPTRRELDLAIREWSDERLDLRLEGGVVVEGVVLDAETEAPLAGAFVWTDDYFWDEGDLGPTAVTDAAGRFRLAGVDAHRQELAAGVEVAVLWVYARTDTHAADLEPVVQAWSADGRYEVVLRLQASSSSVAGLVRDTGGGEPVSGVPVFAIDAAGKIVSATTDEEGRFLLEKLPPGPLLVFSWQGGLESCRTGERLLELAPGEKEELTLELAGSDASRLAGHVLDAGGVGLAGIELECGLILRQEGVTVGSLARRIVETDAEGRFVLAGLPAGRYVLKPSSAAGESAEPRQLEVALGQDEVLEGQDFVVGTSATFAGTLTWDSGEVERLRVRLVEAATGTELQTVEPDAAGRYLFRPVLEGAYSLQVLDGDEVLLDLPVGPAGDRDLPLFVP